MMEIEEKGSIAQEEEEGEEEDGVSCLAAKRMKLMPPSPFEGRVETERDQVCVCVLAHCLSQVFVWCWKFMF